MRKAAGIVVLVLGAVACGGDAGPSQTGAPAADTTSASSDVVSAQAFVDGMCVAMSDWLAVLQGGNDDLQQQLAGAQSPDEAVELLSQYLDKTVEATDALIGDVKALGAPDVEGGEEARDAVVEAFEGVRDALAGAADEVRGMNTSDPQALTEALTNLSTELTNATGDLVGPLARTTIPELEQAYEDSQACDAVKSLGE